MQGTVRALWCANLFDRYAKTWGSRVTLQEGSNDCLWGPVSSASVLSKPMKGKLCLFEEQLVRQEAIWNHSRSGNLITVFVGLCLQQSVQWKGVCSVGWKQTPPRCRFQEIKDKKVNICFCQFNFSGFFWHLLVCLVRHFTKELANGSRKTRIYERWSLHRHVLDVLWFIQINFYLKDVTYWLPSTRSRPNCVTDWMMNAPVRINQTLSHLFLLVFGSWCSTNHYLPSIKPQLLQTCLFTDLRLWTMCTHVWLTFRFFIYWTSNFVKLSIF